MRLHKKDSDQEFFGFSSMEALLNAWNYRDDDDPLCVDKYLCVDKRNELFENDELRKICYLLFNGSGIELDIPYPRSEDIVRCSEDGKYPLLGYLDRINYIDYVFRKYLHDIREEFGIESDEEFRYISDIRRTEMFFKYNDIYYMSFWNKVVKVKYMVDMYGMSVQDAWETSDVEADTILHDYLAKEFEDSDELLSYGNFEKVLNLLSSVSVISSKNIPLFEEEISEFIQEIECNFAVCNGDKDLIDILRYNPKVLRDFSSNIKRLLKDREELLYLKKTLRTNPLILLWGWMKYHRGVSVRVAVKILDILKDGGSEVLELFKKQFNDGIIFKYK